jgi:hypothetical protein
VLSTSRQADLGKPYPVAQASRLCRRRLKPAATKIISLEGEYKIRYEKITGFS